MEETKSYTTQRKPYPFCLKTAQLFQQTNEQNCPRESWILMLLVKE